MTPYENTIFSICLFGALQALQMWTVRRDRNIRGCHDAQKASRKPDTSGEFSALPAATFHSAA